ncbi:PepSY-associated TM helix domain-containing protein [Novosphingobium olei]|uniref:PepSY-associated TM helix domain-containing protein n=1 Tax=Novosphingobium olei TaxID=2728851 RepID=UPI003090127B|nr:PepSY domain-containing protein [Novosphingobium olei]
MAGLPGRPFWVIAHRWAGLSLALFLAVAGLTGALMPWIEELEALTAPELHLSQTPGAPDPLAIRAQVLRRYPGAAVDFLPLTVEPGHSLRLHLHWLDPVTGLEREHGAGVPDWDDLFLDPVTGTELGRREWGDIGQGAKNLMPFVYRLHYTLAAGTAGLLVMGVAAIVWTVDCFVGFFLTLPPRAPGAPFWKRWRPSWQVRRGKSAYKLNFDLHRAGGLWLWPLLLVFAWSSVSFNLPQVHAPVMKLFGAEDAREVFVRNALPAPRNAPRLDFTAATARGEALARDLAKEHGLALRSEGERWLWHVPTSGLYVYGFTTSADIGEHGGGTRIAFDSDSGAVRGVELPSGANGANTFTNWLTALHMAQVFGLPYRVFVSLLGLAVTMLSVTGVVIWMKKRSARAGRRLKTAARPRLSLKRARL